MVNGLQHWLRAEALRNLVPKFNEATDKPLVCMCSTWPHPTWHLCTASLTLDPRLPWFQQKVVPDWKKSWCWLGSCRGCWIPGEVASRLMPKEIPSPNCALSGNIREDSKGTQTVRTSPRKRQSFCQWLEWLDSDPISTCLPSPEDMSRYALDVLGSAMLGQGFGAVDGKFDDTYRRVWHGNHLCGNIASKCFKLVLHVGAPLPSHGLSFAYFFTRSQLCGRSFDQSRSALATSDFALQAIPDRDGRDAEPPSTWPSQSWRDSLSREICVLEEPSTTCTKCWKVLRSNVIYSNALYTVVNKVSAQWVPR